MIQRKSVIQINCDWEGCTVYDFVEWLGPGSVAPPLPLDWAHYIEREITVGPTGGDLYSDTQREICPWCKEHRLNATIQERYRGEQYGY